MWLDTFFDFYIYICNLIIFLSINDINTIKLKCTFILLIKWFAIST